jgi:polyisoprenoid-binding protein YceI
MTDQNPSPAPPAPEPATRSVDGNTLPLPGDWIIDPLHTSLAFEARHFVVTRMRGRFRHGTGVIHIGERPEDSSVVVTIDATTIDTIHPKADEHLRGEHFLDVERFPTITFRSTGVRHLTSDRWAVTGDLTIRDVTREVVLDTEFNGALPAGKVARAKLGFTATTEIDRRDYGVTTNFPLPGSEGFIVGNEVAITIDVEADLPHEPETS